MKDGSESMNGFGGSRVGIGGMCTSAEGRVSYSIIVDSSMIVVELRLVRVSSIELNLVKRPVRASTVTSSH